MPALEKLSYSIGNVPAILSLSWTPCCASPLAVTSSVQSPPFSPCDCAFSPSGSPMGSPPSANIDLPAGIAAILVPLERTEPLPSLPQDIMNDPNIIWSTRTYRNPQIPNTYLPKAALSLIRDFLSASANIKALFVRVPLNTNISESLTFLQSMFPQILEVRLFVPSDSAEDDNLSAIFSHLNPYIAAASVLAVAARTSNFRDLQIRSSAHSLSPGPPLPYAARSSVNPVPQASSATPCPSSPLAQNVYTRPPDFIATPGRRQRDVCYTPTLMSPPSSPGGRTGNNVSSNEESNAYTPHCYRKPYGIGRIGSRSYTELPTNAFYIEGGSPLKRPKPDEPIDPITPTCVPTVMEFQYARPKMQPLVDTQESLSPSGTRTDTQFPSFVPTQ